MDKCATIAGGLACALALSTLTVSDATAQAVDTEGRQLEEIVVRAQKKDRAETLQEVPAAVTAYNEAQLDEIVFQNLSDISYRVPNVSFEEVGTFPGVQNFSIRGQGINSSIPSVDPTVGTFVDGVYIGTTYGVVLDTWDLESVEVLRGPQGLLFGRNVTGGAVLLRTRRPDPSGEPELKARVAATDADRQTYSVAAGAPLIEGVFAARIMGYYEDDDGYFDNVNPLPAFPSPPFTYFNQQPGNRDAGAIETKLARPSFTWTPTDELELTLITEIGNMDGDGAAWTVVDGNPALGIDGQRNGSLGDFETPIDEYGETDLDWRQATFEVNWDIAGGVLTNIAGYRDVDIEATADIDGTGAPIFTASGNTDQDQFSNELRFATRIDDRWDLTFGVYYLTQSIEYREGRYIQVDLTALPALVPAPPPPFGNGSLIATGGDLDTDTYGIFWNNDFALNDEWILNAGLRYSYEEKDAKIITGPPACTDVETFNCTFQKLDGDWDNWIPKLGLQWLFADNAQAYGFWTQGYRTGGFNFRNARPGNPTLLPTDPNYGLPPGPTDQEEQDTFEIGLKADLLDNRLRVNAALFRNEIDNIQRELNTGDPVVIVLQGTVNAGDVTIQGAELEFTGLPTDYLTLRGALGYLDGDYDDKKEPWDGINLVNGEPWLGDELPRLAEWTYSVGATYIIPLEASGELSLSSDFSYRDKNPYDDANLAFFDSQKRWEAFASWLSPNDRWTVTVFGKNLLDETNYGNITSIAGLYNAGPMQRGREYGLQLEFRL